MDFNNAKVASILKMSRNSANKTQTETAEFLGKKNKQTISNWENGLSLPSIEDLAKLSSFFQVDLFSLLANSKEMATSSLDTLLFSIGDTLYFNIGTGRVKVTIVGFEGSNGVSDSFNPTTAPFVRVVRFEHTIQYFTVHYSLLSKIEKRESNISKY